MNVARWLVLMICTTALLGCGRPDTPDQNAKDNKTSKEVTRPDDTTKGDDESKDKSRDPVPTPSAAGPKEAIEQIAAGIANKKPQVFWTALPPKYQQDVTDIFTSYATRMDPEVHSKTFATLRKAVDVLKNQRKNVLGLLKTLPLPVPPEALERFGPVYDGLINVLAVVINSELSNLDELKKADVHAMLAGSGAKIIEQIMAIEEKQKAPLLSELRGKVQVELLKSDGNQATLKITADRLYVPDVAYDLEMVKKDGKWLPKKMVDQWPEMIAQIKGSVNQINPDNIRLFKPKILKVLSVTDVELDRLAAAKSPEELRDLGIKAFAALLAAASMD